jgi:RHS repeat-associated protein
LASVNHRKKAVWNIIAEMRASLSGTNTTGIARQRVYSWGVDMSGSTTGAGGVGGLAFVGEHTLNGTTSTLSRPLSPAYDHNGTVIGHFDCRVTTSGTDTATISISSGRAMTYTFEYDAFGRELSADLTQAGSSTTFPASVAPPIRFSTKYSDIESGWVYYGYRYYSPETGRWVNRDPIGERGGINLYGMVGNNTVERVDYLGLCKDDSCQRGDFLKEKPRLERVAAKAKSFQSGIETDGGSCKGFCSTFFSMLSEERDKLKCWTCVTEVRHRRSAAAAVFGLIGAMGGAFVDHAVVVCTPDLGEGVKGNPTLFDTLSFGSLAAFRTTFPYEGEYSIF